MENLVQVRVAAKTLVAEGVATFDLVPVEGDSLAPFDAGAHIDVHVPDGPVRQYSLYELPGEPRRYRGPTQTAAVAGASALGGTPPAFL